jgi:hypothetical protein
MSGLGEGEHPGLMMSTFTASMPCEKAPYILSVGSTPSAVVTKRIGDESLM